jgi:hypothetical protein
MIRVRDGGFGDLLDLKEIAPAGGRRLGRPGRRTAAGEREQGRSGHRQLDEGTSLHDLTVFDRIP